MNEQKQYVCPWCGGKDVVEGIQSTYAKVQPNKALTLKGENLIHVICKNCGTAVRSYVENPQGLAVRPTSETLFCELFSKTVQSHRDLPKVGGGVPAGGG